MIKEEKAVEEMQEEKKSVKGSQKSQSHLPDGNK
jgi:hypothetical protein